MKRKIFRQAIQAADSLSLGISMVIAVLIGIGLGYLLKIYTGIFWLFWLGVAIGVAAAVLNVYKAYKAQVASYEEFKDENRYKEKGDESPKSEAKDESKGDKAPKNNKKPENKGNKTIKKAIKGAIKQDG